MKQAPVKKVPERHCLGCNQAFPKKDLIRVLRSPDGTLSIDFTGKKSGRGAYLCFSSACFKKARKAGRIEKALNVPIPEEMYNMLQSEIDFAEAQNKESNE